MTNDGATILGQMSVSQPVSKLLRRNAPVLRQSSTCCRSSTKLPSCWYSSPNRKTTRLETARPASSVRSAERWSSRRVVPSKLTRYLSHAVLAGALLENAASLLDRGIHPIKIADGYERACAVAVKELDRVGDVIPFSKDDTSELLKVAQTSMGSKM